MTITRAHFTLVERASITSGRLDIVLRLPDGEITIDGIVVDIIAAARNDERALTYPAAIRAILDDAIIAAATSRLVPEIRLLTRRRVIPLEHDFVV